MPGTTRYSATFDRTYEEEDRADPQPPPNARRSRSLSWQANSGLDGRYTPLGGRPPNQRSSSTDSSQSKFSDHIPTRTVAKTAVKAHNNPFQFVKVGTCPLYRNAEAQLKKVKEVKQPEVLKEEEEDWQSNLDSWKSRRRKMSEDVFKRQEEIRQFELEEQISQVSQKKTKTFSEMVESRASRGRTLSLCLISSPMELQNWEYEGSSHKNGSCSTFSGESEENSTVNSEDEGVSLKGMLEKSSSNNTQNGNHRINGDSHIAENGSKLEANGDYNKLSDLSTNNLQMKPKEGSYIDSGLESISSSHRAGDTPDSGSDFSQDSGSSIDCDSPRTGVNILEEFSSKTLQTLPGQEITVKLCLNEKGQDFGFSFVGGKDEGQVIIASVSKGSKAESSSIHLGDQIITIDGKDISSKKHIEIASIIQKGREKGEISLLLWRHTKSSENNTNGFNVNQKQCSTPIKPSTLETQSSKTQSQQYEKSIESENEMYVDDFEELKRQSEMMSSSTKQETNAQANGNSSPSSVSSKKDIIPKIASSEISSASKSKLPNGSIEEPINKTYEQNVSSKVDNGSQEKSEVKKTKVRRKGVYCLNVPIASNQNSNEGTPVNSLFPLSPVTELPSPEDSKTLSSGLSSKLCTSISDSLKGSSPKETPKEAETPPPKNKDNIITATTAVETVNSKSAISPKKDENKIETTVPSSPTGMKGKEKIASVGSPQEEKPKLVLKKVKTKTKKANASDNNSLSSQTNKEVSNSVPSSPTSPCVKTLANDTIAKELKPCFPNGDMQKKETESSPKMENKPSTTVNAKSASSGDSTGKSLKKIENAVESAMLSSPSVPKNKTLTESPQNEKPKSSISSSPAVQNTKATVQSSQDEKSKTAISSSPALSKGKFPVENSKDDKVKPIVTLPPAVPKAKTSIENRQEEKLKSGVSTTNAVSKAKTSVENQEDKPKPAVSTINAIPKTKTSVENQEEKPKPAITTTNAVSKAKTPVENQEEKPKPAVSAINAVSKPKTSVENQEEKTKPAVTTTNAVSKAKNPVENQEEKPKPAVSTINSVSKAKTSVENQEEKPKPAVTTINAVSKAKTPVENQEEKSKPAVSTTNSVSKAKTSVENQEEKPKPAVTTTNAIAKAKTSIENHQEEKLKSAATTTNASAKAKLSVKNDQEEKSKPAGTTISAVAQAKAAIENNQDQKSKSAVSSTPAVSKVKLPVQSPKDDKVKPVVSLPPAVPKAKTSVENYQEEKPKPAVSTTNAVPKAKASVEDHQEEKLIPSVSTINAVPKAKTSVENHQEEKPKPALSTTSAVAKAKAAIESRLEEKSKPPASSINAVSRAKIAIEGSQDEKPKSDVSSTTAVSKVKTSVGSQQIEKSKPPGPPTGLKVKIVTESPQNEKSKHVPASPVDLKKDALLSPKDETSKPVLPASPSDTKAKNLVESPLEEKPKPILRKVKKVKKVNTSENVSSASPQVIKEVSTVSTPPSPTSLASKSLVKDNTVKDSKSSSQNKDKQEKDANVIKKAESSEEKGTHSAGTTPVTEITAPKYKIPISSAATTTTKEIQSVKSDVKKESVNTSSSSSTTNIRQSVTPAVISQDKKAQLTVSQKQATTKESDSHSLSTKAVSDNLEKRESQNSPATTVSPCNIKSIASQITDKKNESVIPSPEVATVQNDMTKSSVNSQDEKSKTTGSKKNKNRSRKKNANSQKVNTQAKQIEECKNPNIDSLNIIYESEPKNTNSENLSSNVKNSSSSEKISVDLVPDIPPVEKVAEEMEKLILEQLEEEERAKELASGLQIKNTVGSPESLLTAPPKLAEPPKEKPPPPPATEEIQNTHKDMPLKRVNSTKRIKKEIHKRRSNFLGIDNADESISNEPSVPPPPALEEILKAEMELDRQSRLKIESAADERLIQEENEIIQKEREIIESLESEERQKQLLSETPDFKKGSPNKANDVITEEDRILALKNERMRLEAERLINEEQQFHLMEEKQLREREEFIRKQESSVSLSGVNGDGKSLTSKSSAELSESKSSPPELCESKSAECDEKNKVPQKPAVPPKPLKKKEAIRKERERLRQEQEALQREREEHRRKLIQEQEELMKHQKSHAPDVPVSRLGPLPPLVQPSFPPPLTSTMNAAPNTRESGPFPSRSHHGAPNGPAGSINTAELIGPPAVRQNRMPASRKAVQNEAWGQQKEKGNSTTSVPPNKDVTPNSTSSESSSASKSKANVNGSVAEPIKNEQKLNSELDKGNQKKSEGKVKTKNKGKKKMPSVRKQNHDSLTESRYNQNHWLIQEAEMRRITELKERQRVVQLPCSQTHLAEDDVCSNPPRVPVIPPTHNQHLNYAVQDKMWNYGQPNASFKKYPPPVVKDPLHTVYPRETVTQQPPTKPSRVVPMERQEQMLSVSGRKRCSHCNEELGRGAAMIIESLQLYYHIHCFQCCVCQAQLGNGSCGTDVRVRNNKLHCHNCYSNDEAGLKFSQV